MDSKHLSLLCDFYELTMGNGYFVSGYRDKITYFDIFFRRVPDGGGYAIFAGLEQLISYIQDLHFEEEDIEFLRGKGIFDEGFLEYLRTFRFTGDIWAMPEGTPIFPNEPLVTVRAPALEAQLIETYALLVINHQSLIATKASRIVRAHGEDAAITGARAAYIGGCHGTACTLSEALYGVPAGGTMAHSWVQMFDSEYEAFKTYCEIYPTNATLLVDTYNTLKSGVPNAIRVFKEQLLPQGFDKFAIRLDSGDLAFLSRTARAMLDEAGLHNCKIVASNALDEWLIRDLLMQGARIDTFGVGEKLITASSEPVFGGVYKLVAIEDETGSVLPRIKISEHPDKITNPHFKKVYRIFRKATGKAIADQICVWDETIDESQPLELFDPKATWKRNKVSGFYVQELQIPIFRQGKLVYQQPKLAEMRRYCAEQLDTLWDEVKRFENPHRYAVDLSWKLWYIKEDLLFANRENA
jgi:nicotinate phosphoribosyltransferase